MNTKKVYKVGNKNKFNLIKMGSDWNIKPHYFPWVGSNKSLDASSEFEDSNCDSCKILFSQLTVTNNNDRNIYERKININNIN